MRSIAPSSISKRCTKCGAEKPFADFYNRSRSKDGKASACKTCTDIKVAEYRRRNPHIYRQSMRKHLYGLSDPEFQAMKVTQGDACAICGDVPEGALHVDHDHATGVVRALLCGRCNRGIGMFREEPRILRAALAYVEAFAALED